MKKVDFKNVSDTVVEVLVDEEKCGVIKYDVKQGVWVLWLKGTDEGTAYFESLEQTQDTITDSIQGHHDNFEDFDDDLNDSDEDTEGFDGEIEDFDEETEITIEEDEDLEDEALGYEDENFD